MVPGRITLHAPPAFSASFAPAQPRCQPFSRQKGAFLPPTPAVPAVFARPNAPFCPGAARFLPGAPRKKTRLCPFLPGTPAPLRTPGTPEALSCAAFCPPAPAFAAARRRFSANPPEESPAAAEKPPAEPAAQPVAAARRPKVSPPPHQGTALGQGNPDCRGRLFRFAVEKCATPRGDLIPVHDG